MSTAEKMTPTEAQKLVDLMNAPEPEDLTGRLSNWLSRRKQSRCQQVVTQYAQSEAESKCGTSMQLRICDDCRQPYCPKHIADHDCPEGEDFSEHERRTR